jgi:hypothetical protein
MRMLALLLTVTQGVSFSQTGRLQHHFLERDALVDQARQLPPEFHSDTLLRIAASSLVDKKSRKQELVEEAYWSATHAPHPYLQHADENSNSVAANAVRANGLDALTLKTRAVQALIALDAAAALTLFQRIEPLRLPRPTCETVFTDDVGAYYRTAALLFPSSFAAKQRANGEDLLFLRQIIRSIEYAPQVPPALELIFSSRLSPDQRLELLSLLAATVQQLSASDREYGATENAIIASIPAEHITYAEADVLVPALRTYIVRHVSARRCADNLPPIGKIAKSADQLNGLLGKLDPQELRFRRISADEAKPSGDAGTYERDLIGQSEKAQDILDALRWLTHGNRELNGEVVRWTLQERSTQKWLAHYDDTLRLIHELTEDDENSPGAFFCMKADALNVLATLAPPGPAREKAMEDYRAFLEDYYYSIDNSNLWFTMFRHMLYTARFSDDPKNKLWILSELERSSNPVIAFYAELETTIDPPS